MSIIYGYNGTNWRKIRIDTSTRSLQTIDYAHHEIHGGSSYTAHYTLTTAASNSHRTGLYIKTPASKQVHGVVSFSASTAAAYSICEAPTIAANTGTHGVAIYNRNRDSTNTSLITDNATSPAANKVTTLTEAQIDGDGTWATGTVIRTSPLQVGVGPRAAGGDSRGSQEYILKASTAYVFLITNTAASANAHHILFDWYEHTEKGV